MASNNNLISGSAMMVLLGVILIIGPWTILESFSAKFLLTIVGTGLILLGGHFSKG